MSISDEEHEVRMCKERLPKAKSFIWDQSLMRMREHAHCRNIVSLAGDKRRSRRSNMRWKDAHDNTNAHGI